MATTRKANAPKKASTPPSPWSAAQRKRLSAIRNGAAAPKGFYFDAPAAWALLGEGEPLPDELSPERERGRAASLGPPSWRERPGRCFTDEHFNPLIALWVAKGGWDFVFDRVMPNTDDPWTSEFSARNADPGAVWYAIRRYLHAATPEEFERARRRVEPVMNLAVPVVPPASEYPSADHWYVDYQRSHDISRAQAHVAFAFDRETDWVHQLLRGYVERDVLPADMPVLAAAATDADLLLRALKKYGGLSEVYFVYDMVESMGARAVPVLDVVRAGRSANAKRLADARSIAKALPRTASPREGR